MTTAPLDAAPRLYARVSRRLQASMIDGVIYMLSPAAMLLVSSFTSGSAAAARTIVVGWLLGILLYEPVLVALRGSTIGHVWANIRVVDASTGRPPAFWRAFLRFIVKGILGIFSFALVTTTIRHQAAHDLAAGTTVEIRDLWRVRPGDYLHARVVDPLASPAPIPRRVAVTLGYSLVWLALVVTAYVATRDEPCLVGARCTRVEDLTGLLLLTAWFAAQVMCLVLGLGGRLPGARPSPRPSSASA